MSHTPGPWVYRGYWNDAHFSVDPLFSYSQGETDFPQGIKEDDLRLFAAAPDLLECLQEIVAMQEMCLGNATMTHIHLGGLVEMARIAIYKATEGGPEGYSEDE